MNSGPETSESCQEFSESENNSRIIFTIARMNPPTPGHLLLIENLIQKAIDRNVCDVYILLSKSQDFDTNPISCEDKIRMLSDASSPIRETIANKMISELKSEMIKSNSSSVNYTADKINNVVVHLKCFDQSFRALSELIGTYSEKWPEKQINLTMIVGSDREPFIKSITNYYTRNGMVNSVEGVLLDRPVSVNYNNYSDSELETLDTSAVDRKGISGTFVRRLVKLELRDKFNGVYGNYLTSDDKDHLYNKIRESYSQRHALPVDGVVGSTARRKKRKPPVGGRKTKTRKTKTRKIKTGKPKTGKSKTRKSKSKR